MSLTSQEFKAVIKSKGWTLKGVAMRWGITDVWMYNLAANPERPIHYDDAAFGLPSKSNAERQDKRRRYPLSAQDFKDLVKQKGWTQRAIAERWCFSDVWMYNLAGNIERPAHYGDAIFGLASKTNLVRQEKRRRARAGRSIDSSYMYEAGEILCAIKAVGSMAEEGERCRIVDRKKAGELNLYKVSFSNNDADWFEEGLIAEYFAQTGLRGDL